MSIENELADFVSNEVAVVGRGQPVAHDEKLVSVGRVDSLGLIQLLDFVHQRYGVDLMAKGNPADFDTVSGVAHAVRAQVP